ncbi:MAG TPA: carotenoid oxygenase family protein [Bryobacteraceae bacterium]|nr:carotenoid oxygenase family protein [Bryobacteraceae bacterium]
MAQPFPHTMDFGGWNAPSRIECDIYDLVVEGSLPEEINGNWYRSIPDPQYSPMLGDDTYLSGDGMVSLFRFENGHVDFKMRYVKTERWKNERAARRSLYGLYRNPYTDDPSVQGKPRNVNNTTPVWHAGKLFATKEDSHAMEMDPHTLETIGMWDYDGKLKSQTMTAHTRLAPDTGDLYFFGYEAGGLCTRDVAFCVADKKGNLVREEWFEAPYVALMHDFAVTREHVVFPVFPITANLERIQAGGHHWIFEQDKESFIGILPRDAHVKHMRWFRGPARSSFHFMNAYSEGNFVHLYFGVSKVPPFPFMQKASGISLRPDQVRIGFVRWTFDLSKPGDTFEEHVIGPSGDMPRTALKDQMRDFEIGYYQTFDPRNAPQDGPPPIAGPVGAGFNTILRMEVKTGKHTKLSLGPAVTVQEHVHIPSKSPGHEGYLAFVCDMHDQQLSEVAVVEAEHIEKGPIARIKIPFRLRVQVHGSWVPAEEL